MQGSKEPLLLACEESKPSYQRLEELMQPIFRRWVGLLCYAMHAVWTRCRGRAGGGRMLPAGL